MKPKQSGCHADKLDTNGVSIWDDSRRKCNACGVVYAFSERCCPTCLCPEFSLVRRTAVTTVTDPVEKP